MSIFNETGGFTNIANDLSKDATPLLRPLLVEYMNKGMSIDEISYLMNSVVDKICLRNQIEQRINKDKHKEEVK